MFVSLRIIVLQDQNAIHCPNVSTTPITAMGCRQCLPFSVVQLKGKHLREPHCRNGVVDTFGLNPSITDRVHRNENFVEINPV